MPWRNPWCWLVLLLTGLGVAHVHAAATAEYRLKAAFIYKFATYVRWPASENPGPSDPFVIGILGSDPFSTSFDEVVRGQSVQGRPIRIKRLLRTEDALTCELVFVSASEETNLSRILALLRGAPVLTISDLDRFAENGGMIGLVTTEDKPITFDINKSAVERAGLKASSQLLQLARIVDDNSGGQR